MHTCKYRENLRNIYIYRYITGHWLGSAPSPTHWCSSYRKGSLRVTLDYGRQLYLLYIYIYMYIYIYVEK